MHFVAPQVPSSDISKLLATKEMTMAKLREDVQKLQSELDSIESSFLKKHRSKLRLETKVPHNSFYQFHPESEDIWNTFTFSWV